MNFLNADYTMWTGLKPMYGSRQRFADHITYKVIRTKKGERQRTKKLVTLIPMKNIVNGKFST